MTVIAKRGFFSNRIGFILAAAGAAVGLGNIWRFPFKLAEGGGAIFLLVYLFFYAILGLPIMIAEVTMGRAAKKDPVGTYTTLGGKKWSHAGKIGVLAAIIILSFYNIVAGWSFQYFIEMLKGNFYVGNQFNEIQQNIPSMIGYSLVFMGCTAFIISRGVVGGIEKASRILMPALATLLVFLMIYAFQLEHAGTGLRYYLQPDFSELNLSVISAALGQAFFSLSLGLGACITYGSYLPPRSNIASSSLLVVLTDATIAFCAGLMIFPFVAYLNAGDMNHISGGPGLIFQTLPAGFESLGHIWGRIIGSVFFLLLAFAALTSTLSLLEISTSYVIGQWKLPRKKAVLVVAVMIYLIGIPTMYSFGASPQLTHLVRYIGSSTKVSFFTLMDHIGSETLLPLGGLLVAIFAGYRWKRAGFAKELKDGYTGRSFIVVEQFLHFSIAYLCPVMLGILLVANVLNRFFGISVI